MSDETVNPILTVGNLVYRLHDVVGRHGRMQAENEWDASVSFHPRDTTKEQDLASRIAAALNACDGVDDPQPGELARLRASAAKARRDTPADHDGYPVEMVEAIESDSGVAE